MAGRKQEQDNRKLVDQHEQEIEKEIHRWNYIMKNGASDPCWPDGVNMNLVRNHIIYHLQKIQELSERPMQLSIFDTIPGMPTQQILADKRIPPLVDDNFMATDRIPWSLRNMEA